MNANAAVLAAIGVGVAGAVVTALLARARAAAGWAACLVTAVSSGLVLVAAGTVLVTGRPAEPLEWAVLPALGSSLRIHVDGLSAVFLGLVALIALLAALYAVRYMDHYRDLGVRRYYPHVQLFVAGMYGILATSDLMLFFFLFWQLMTVPSFLLVRFEWQKAENVRAANRYLIMMELSCVLVMIAAGLLGGAATVPAEHAAPLARFDFDRIGAGLPALLATQPGLVGVALFLFLVGFGIKAGMWPFGQLWLPAAHPAAPSPVSALLSGVMIKTGVYGLMRTFFWLVPEEAMASFPATRWGGLLALLGTLTLLIGTVQALKQEQTKRLLAFHSIGQVGYILLGLGVALVFLRPGRSDPALLALGAVGFAGALFHTVNHALFKSLLFFNAGSMLAATGTQDLNRLGGLMRFMPLTGLTALIASFSIAGVPLFNGFASKWSLYVAAFLGGPEARAGSLAIRFLPLCGLVAILTSAVTLASFLKFFGTSFLSRTSSLVAGRAARGPMEAGGTMLVPQGILAVACILLGLVPVLGYRLVQGVLASSPAGLGPLLARGGLDGIGGIGGVPVSGGLALLAPLVLLLVLGLLFLAARWIARLGGADRREAEPWLCGYVGEAEVYRYRAHGWYGEVKRYLGWAGGTPGHEVPPPDRVETPRDPAEERT